MDFEGGAFPVVQGLINGDFFGPPSKLGFMTGFTNDLANYAVEDAFVLFSRMMTETSRITLDKVLFSTAAATSKSQAGLLYGVTPLPTPTAGGGLAALVGDLKQLAGAMATAGVTSDGAIIVAHPQQVEVLNTLPPQPLRHDVFGTTAVPVGTVIMIQTEGLATGYDGDAMIFVSPNAAAHMEGATPQNIGTAGTPNEVAAPTISAFQTDSQLLKLVLRCAWMIRPGRDPVRRECDMVTPMEVSELLAQRDRLRAERSAAAEDEPEFVLTARELDHILRREFAARERSMQEVIDRKVREALAGINDAVERMIAEHRADVEHALSQHRAASIDWIRASAKAITDDRAEIEKLKEAFDLRLSALLQAVEKMQRGFGDDAKVIDLPNPWRDRRA